jgi:general stress protein 26
MARDEAIETEVPLKKKLDDLYKLIEGIAIAMFTTRRRDGQLVSRPMATQRHESGADLWFVTDVESQKMEDLTSDPHVSLAYYNVNTHEWVSVSGVVTVSQNRELIRRLYAPDWKAWFGDDGGERDAGPNDPRFALLLVEAQSVLYGKHNTSKPLVLFELVTGMLTGKEPDVADVRHVSGDELR